MQTQVPTFRIMGHGSWGNPHKATRVSLGQSPETHSDMKFFIRPLGRRAPQPENVRNNSRNLCPSFFRDSPQNVDTTNRVPVHWHAL